MLAAMSDLTLEIVEGPGAGRQVRLDRPTVVGRAPDADLVLEDGQASRHHARITPASGGSTFVEDLGSANGTFVNQNELVGPSRLDPGDELLIGVTLMEVRASAAVASQPSAVRAIPAGLAIAPRTPDYVNPAVIAAETGGAGSGGGTPELDQFRDVRVRRRAQLAPLFFALLIAVALVAYFLTR
jgi:predicted component of type VI protein secretion system